MIELKRLLWIRMNQKELRADLYKGLSDALVNGEINASAIGKQVVLPSSFTGGASYMMVNYQNTTSIAKQLVILIYLLHSLATQFGHDN